MIKTGFRDHVDAHQDVTNNYLWLSRWSLCLISNRSIALILLKVSLLASKTLAPYIVLLQTKWYTLYVPFYLVQLLMKPAWRITPGQNLSFTHHMYVYTQQYLAIYCCINLTTARWRCAPRWVRTCSRDDSLLLQVCTSSITERVNGSAHAKDCSSVLAILRVGTFAWWLNYTAGVLLRV